MCWTRLVLVRTAANLYSASPLKHHPMAKQCCPNPDHYSDSEPARRSLTLMWWALSRTVEPQIFTYFLWHGRGSNKQPPACQANAQPLHYPAAVHRKRIPTRNSLLMENSKQNICIGLDVLQTKYVFFSLKFLYPPISRQVPITVSYVNTLVRCIPVRSTAFCCSFYVCRNDHSQ